MTQDPIPHRHILREPGAVRLKSKCNWRQGRRGYVACRDPRRLYQQLKRRYDNGGVVSGDERERLRELCRESDKANRELVEVIQSDKLIAASYCREGKYEQAVQAVDAACRDHWLRRCGKPWRLKVEFASLQSRAERPKGMTIRWRVGRSTLLDDLQVHQVG